MIFFLNLAALLLLSFGCVTHLYALFIIRHSAGRLTVMYNLYCLQ